MSNDASRKISSETLRLLESCRHASVDQISDAFAGLDQDAVVSDLAVLIATTTDLEALPKRPFAVQMTMLGDLDVSEAAIRYDDDWVVTESVPCPDIRVRWERWEDAVRLFNGDVSALALYYARRVSFLGEPAKPMPPDWWRAINFAPGTKVQSQQNLLVLIADAFSVGRKTLESLVRREGLLQILEARWTVVHSAFLESGLADSLNGRVVAARIEADTPARFGVRIGEQGVTPVYDDECGTADVQVQYANPEAFLAAVTGSRPFQELIINGLVHITGDADCRERYGQTLLGFGRLHATA